jgi:REP element-mobilizing transposase RayT
MPNHVHTLIETFEGYPLPRVIHSWKSYTAKQANQILGRTGQFWAVDYFDHYIHDEKHFGAAVNYIHNNPVKAGLVSTSEVWPFSSAAHWNADVSSAL